MSRFFSVAVLAAVILCCGSVSIYAADLSAQSKTEIDYLFSYLKNSGCQLNRNEKWHSADEAVSHLGTKYKYLLENNMLSSTEDFIDKAATSSSTSGKPYFVKCANEEPIQSSVWLKAELSKYRSEER
jgi:basic membrane lipoprotein Med (substrate-binding protein (PBP1-ABC) superfamily)